MKLKNNVIRFDILHGKCAACEGPVYFSRVIDWEGNRINTLHCWNGHYQSLEIDHLIPGSQQELTAEQVEKILPFIGFVRVDGKKE